MLIVGEKEESEGKVSVRRHGGEDLGSMSLQEFKTLAQKEITENIDEFVV